MILAAPKRAAAGWGLSNLWCQTSLVLVVRLEQRRAEGIHPLFILERESRLGCATIPVPVATSGAPGIVLNRGERA